MSDEIQRMLITKIVRKNETRADLIGRGRRFPEIYVFDISSLSDAGIDYASLPVGVETPCRLWALYTESDKLNKAGQPYRDLIAVEPFRPNGHAQDTASDLDLTDILSELRAIRILLEQVVGQKAIIPDADDEPSLPDDPPDDTWPEEPVPAEQLRREVATEKGNGNGAGKGASPLSDEEAKREFFKLAGPAIIQKRIGADRVNELAQEGRMKGFGDTLRTLKAEIGG